MSRPSLPDSLSPWPPQGAVRLHPPSLRRAVLGRTLCYTYEVADLIPDELLVMATAEGPFAMETSYT